MMFRVRPSVRRSVRGQSQASASPLRIKHKQVVIPPAGAGTRIAPEINMLGYYFKLAVRSLRRNPVLTALMIAAVGVGIGASMTMLTNLRVMTGDPIPGKSAQLFAPQLDVWGPDSRHAAGAAGGDRLLDTFTYRDAMAF